MGQDIASSRFTEQDFAEFSRRVRDETRILEQWFAEGRLDESEPSAGFELEAWLIDAAGHPAPRIESVLATLDDPSVVPELATFNIEFNGAAAHLRGSALSTLAQDLRATLERTTQAAGRHDCRLGLIGILPTVRPEDLRLDFMTPRERYRALNEQVFAQRHGHPLRLRIEGREYIDLEWCDVMLESAATSFQIHIRIGAQESARVYNAAKLISGPLVAIGANSPYLFGRDLWDETRIPLFEQAVSVGGSILQERVGFGFRYARHSLLETFQSNRDDYPVLLPHLMDEPPERLAHLRLHNGTIWRWNRPLIGFEPDGRPHLRLEHRTLPSGPSVADLIANAALYLGLIAHLSREQPSPESRLAFAHTKRNFYACAREGLSADIRWLDGRTHPVTQVLAEALIPRARQGLSDLGIDPPEIDYWLGLIERRLATGRTGTRWQRDWVRRHGPDMMGLTQAYLEQQTHGRPVHEWSLD